MAERIRIPQGPGARLNMPAVPAGTGGEMIAELGDTLTKIAQAKRDVQDTIEANELLAEHTIRSREKQSELLRTDLDDEQIVPSYQTELETINQEIIGKAKSDNVRNMLSAQLPGRSAGKVNEMRAESDSRFTAKALGRDLEAEQMISKAYAIAGTDEERASLKQMRIDSIGVLASRGVYNENEKKKAISKSLHGFELYEAQRAVQTNPSLGLKALTEPAEFLKQFPNLKIEDLDKIFSESVQVEERRYQLLQRKRKDVRELHESAIDEAVIRNQMDWNTLNALREQGMISPERYRAAATQLQKNLEEGTTAANDPSFKGNLETQIRLNPYSVKIGAVMEGLNSGKLSRKDANELLDLKQKWQKALKEDAESTDPRLKGPLYQTGKGKIDRIIGKGMGGIFGLIDAETQRQWGAATDEYQARLMKERDKTPAEIADDIILKFKGPPDKTIVPKGYQKKDGSPDHQKLLDAMKTVKDPTARKFIDTMIEALMEAEKQGLPGQ